MNNTVFDEEHVISVLSAHIDEILNWLTEDNLNNVSPMDLLPQNLRHSYFNRKAFRKACDEGYFTLENGVLISHFVSKLQFSYFCGRCFSNDYTEKVVKRKYWRKGKNKFPARQLERFFGVENLRESRKNNLGKRISKELELIDNLFV